jgi:hypothetical protein
MLQLVTEIFYHNLTARQRFDGIFKGQEAARAGGG